MNSKGKALDKVAKKDNDKAFHQRLMKSLLGHGFDNVRTVSSKGVRSKSIKEMAEGK